jgi:signal transduction histidine kinase
MTAGRIGRGSSRGSALPHEGELAEALAQQRATSEILRLISQSHATAQPVFETIATAALRLCGATAANVFTFDGELLHVATLAVPNPVAADTIRRAFPRPPDRATTASRAVLTRDVAAIPDVLKDPDYAIGTAAEAAGFRSNLGIPLMQAGRPIGAISVGRAKAGPFPETQVALLKTFADQAAIENVRLFRELEEKTRQLEIASAHKSAFLANMSHELRTPLNAIIGFTRIVMRRSKERLETQQYENLEKILTSGQHLLALINEILDLAKVESGRIEIRPGEVALAVVLEQCLRTIEPLVDASAVSLVGAFDGALPPIYVDEEKLRQIVINLLSNAVKFTAVGRIELRASATNGSVEISVADTGIGIPADGLERVFEEFEQVDGGTLRAHGGTGLGLAIARRLARLMGGDICVESTPDAGSTFALSLPQRYGSSRT